MSHRILQVTKEYRAGKHQFVTVGTSSNLGDSLDDQVENAPLQTLTMVGGNVGIGTTNPLAKTHLFLSEYGHGDVLRIDDGVQQRSLFVIQDDGNVGIGTLSSHQRLHLHDGNAILTGSGNVGIGTSTMAVKFEVHSTDAMLLPKGVTDERPIEGVTGYIRYNTTTSTFEGYGAGDAWGSLGGVKDTNQDTYISAELYPGSNDDALRFVTCNVQRMTIDAYGNVGMGTTLPLQDLHVIGGILATSHVEIGTITNDESYVSTQNVDAEFSFGVRQGDGVSASFIWGSTSNDLKIGTDNQERLRILGDGRIGIGTSMPLESLDVDGSIRASYQVLGSDNGMADAKPSFAFTEDITTGVFLALCNVLAFSTNATERVRVGSDGNVGIGTTIPLKPLHVEGDMYASGTMFASNLQILGDFVTLNTVTSNTEQMVIHNDGTGPALRVIQSGDNSVAEFYDQESGTALFIDNNGKIGMGTSMPPVTLSIFATDGVLLPKGTTDERPEGIQGLIRYNTNTNVFEGYGAGDAWGSLGGVKDTNQDTYIAAELYPGSNDDALRFVTCNVQRMTIDSYGNVGIGTSIMGSLVDIYGASTSTNPIVTINQQGTGTILDVQDGGVSALTVIDGGNVGIGLTEPMDTLHVEGGIISTNTQTSNLTIWNSLNIPMTSTNIRTRVQVHHVRKIFYIRSPSQSDFVVTYPGAFSGHQSNVQVFRGRSQLYYVSPTIKDYDLTLTYLMEQQVTEYTISLSRPAGYGDIVDIIVWPQITQNSPEEQGIVFQSVLVNDSYWLEQGKTIPVRNTVPIYVLGNVGIGTTMPLEKLDIHGNVQVNGGVSITGNVLVTGDIAPSACNIFNLGSSNYRFKDLFLSGNTIDLGGTLITRNESVGGGGGIKVTSDTGEVVDTTVRNLFALGNIGIGLSNPQARLDVDGGVQVGGHVVPSVNTTFDLGTPINRFRDLYLSGNTLDLGGTLLKRHVTGPLMVMSEATQSMESIIGRHAYIEGTANACNVIINTNGTGTSLLINQSGAQTIADFQSLGESVVLIEQTGRVGINTSPAEALHVHGNVLASGNILASGTITASNLVILGDYVTLDTITSNTEQMVITNDGTGPALIVTQTGPQPIADFYDDGGELAMRIADGGNVGIGTKTPLQKLHVNGAVQAHTQFLGQASDSVTAPSFSWATDTNTGLYLPVVDQIGIVTAGAERLRVIANGNVGIGTTQPLQALHVQGAVQAHTQFLGQASDTVSTPSFSWATDTNTGLYLPAVDQIGIVTAGAERARVIANGNVGIGTTQPLQALHVQGAVQAHTQFLGQANDSVSAPSFSWATDTNTGLYLPVTDQIGIVTAGVERARVIANGNVGIGTNIPNGKLHVFGDILASKSISGKGFDAYTKATDYASIQGTHTSNPTSEAWHSLFHFSDNDGRVGNIHCLPTNDEDASGYFVDYTVPSGMTSAYIAHLPWSDCRYFDLVGVYADGSTRFLLRVNNYNSFTTSSNGQHDGSTIVPIAGVELYTKIRIQGRRGRYHLMGVAWDKKDRQNHAAGQTGFVDVDNLIGKRLYIFGRFTESSGYVTLVYKEGSISVTSSTYLYPPRNGLYLIGFNTILQTNYGRSDIMIRKNNGSGTNSHSIATLNEANGDGYHYRSASIVWNLVTTDHIRFQNNGTVTTYGDNEWTSFYMVYLF